MGFNPKSGGANPTRRLSAAEAAAGDDSTRRFESPVESGLPIEELIERLKKRGTNNAHFEMKGELGRGGMGEVWRVHDADLRRDMALKIVRIDPDAPEGTPAPPRTLARFLEEAQVTGQLSHPAIVPVHEIGVDSKGRVFFTMQLVRGKTFREVIEWAWTGQEGWNLTRAITALTQAGNALAYAHSKRVIHRDIKPDNIMVGRFGETYVMDWGLARVMGEEDTHDVSPAPESMSYSQTYSQIDTGRKDLGADGSDAPFLTMDGDVLGTANYMPPEQAFGKRSEIDQRSDIYSLGAVIYQLLTKRAPYSEPGARMRPWDIVQMVRFGPPAPVAQLAKEVPAELIAICEKAMARDPEQRYPDMQAMVADLRAYVEHRVVRAYATGAVAELRKWVERNRSLAASVAAALLLLVGGVSFVAWQRDQHGREMTAKNRDLEAAQLSLKQRNTELEAARDDAQRRFEDVKRLSDSKRLRQLERRAEDLWPAWPGRVSHMTRWLEDAEKLHARREIHQQSLNALRQDRALQPADDAAIEKAAATTDEVWRFNDDETQWWHDQLTELVRDLTALGAPLAISATAKEAWSSDAPAEAIAPAAATLAGVRRRIDHARWVARISGDDAVDDWTEAIERIRGQPMHGGLEISEQVGLVPIGPDPNSGLEEFWHVESGARPVRDESTRRLGMEESTGVVFVLLPGGTFQMGSQREIDPHSKPEEQPIHAVTLAPFFLSKFELTQAQWERLTGVNPSHFSLLGASGKAYPKTSPVEQISWDECTRLCATLQLALPSEAQWEYAARSGTSNIWWTGNERDSVKLGGNVNDQSKGRAYGVDSFTESWLDGFKDVAVVGRFAANGFGLHDTLGNVWEWCADEYEDHAYLRPTRAGDGLRLLDPGVNRRRVYRGGGWLNGSISARSADRHSDGPAYRDFELGLRPARVLTP